MVGVDFIQIAIDRLRLDCARFVVVPGDQKDLLRIPACVPLAN
jgi:hypothetical protein